MDTFFDDPLGLDPLSPRPSRDPRWFVPAHGAGSFRTANLSGRETAIAPSAPIPAAAMLAAAVSSLESAQLRGAA